jgi:selenium metabolism protein YedF
MNIMENQSHVVDVRGRACPQPVILTRQALEQSQQDLVTVVADNDTARDNIVKMAESLSCEVEVDRRGHDYYIAITKPDDFGTSLEPREEILFLVASDSLGRGSEDLGSLLMKNCFYALSEQGGLGKVIIFINGGVKLACTGSPALDFLLELQRDGAEIFACGTCLDYFNLKEQLSVGQVTNMYTILDYLQKVPKVIYL